MASVANTHATLRTQLRLDSKWLKTDPQVSTKAVYELAATAMAMAVSQHHHVLEYRMSLVDILSNRAQFHGSAYRGILRLCIKELCATTIP